MKSSVVRHLLSITAAWLAVVAPAAGGESESAAPHASSPTPAGNGVDRPAVGFTMAQVGPGPAVMTTALSIPDGGGTRTMLVRAAGPTLATLGVTGPLTHPVIAIFDARGLKVAGNDDWTTDAAPITDASTAAGTFPFPADSKDAAVIAKLPPGHYTVQVGSAGGDTGIALLEVYDVTETRITDVNGTPANGGSGNAAMLTTTGQSRSSYEPQLLFHLPLTTSVDDVAGSRNVIRATAVTMRDGAAWFDGKQSQIALSHVALDHRAFAVALWIKLEDDYPSIGLVQERAAHRRNQHFHLVIRNSTPHLGFYSNDLRTPTTVTPQSGWTHLVFQFTGRQQEIWINGKRVGQRDANPYVGTTGDFIIGKAPHWVNVPAHDFKGGMRDLRVYSRALTPVEIGALAKK